MYYIFTLLLILASISSESIILCAFGKSFFNPRSQCSNMARWIASQPINLYKADTNTLNGSIFVTPEYGKTVNARKLADYIFFNASSSMIFGPSATDASGVANPAGSTTTVFATNFFLNNDFSSIVTASPHVKNTIIDINLYVGLDNWFSGFFFRADAPLVMTSWDINLKETITSKGSTIAAETFGNFADSPAPVTSAIEAWKGQTVDIENFPQLKKKLQFARIDGAQKKIGFADLTFMIGYNFYLTQNSHFGLSAATIIPLEDRPSPEFLFTPVLGNGGYTEVGVGITGHHLLYDNTIDSCSIHLEGVLYHVLKSDQKRTFDINNNGVASRYLLLKKISNTNPFTYDDEIIFGPNVTTLECSVYNNIHADIALMVAYQKNSVNLNIGYNIWARSKDIVNIVGAIPPNTYGIQGATQTDNESVNFTQSLSTIKGFFAPPFPGDTVTLSTQDLNISSASHPRALSHKLFASLRYTWNCTHYIPFIGFGGQYEISLHDNNAFNQWGAWLTAGFSFT